MKKKTLVKGDAPKSSTKGMLKPEYEKAFPATYPASNDQVTREQFLDNPTKYPFLKHFLANPEEVFSVEVKDKGSLHSKIENGVIHLNREKKPDPKTTKAPAAEKQPAKEVSTDKEEPAVKEEAVAKGAAAESKPKRTRTK